jgi:hypothetical protein
MVGFLGCSGDRTGKAKSVLLSTYCPWVRNNKPQKLPLKTTIGA